MAGVEAITLEVPDAAAAEEFYAAAFGAGSRLRLRTSDAPTTGFRGFTLSLIVSQPADVDVKASKRFYVERGLPVGKSFGGRYVEFDTPSAPVKLSLLGRRALAEDAGVPPDGSGSHRLVIGGATEPFTDPDGFAWGPGTEE